MTSVDIPKTFGALLLGGLFAAVLSGVVAVQIIIYFKLYPTDSLRLKCLVMIIWFLDTCHTGFIWSALWEYLIIGFGLPENIELIPCFFAHRIFLRGFLSFVIDSASTNGDFVIVSRRNWWLTIFIVIVAVFRLVSACATTGEMIRLNSFSLFQAQFRWLFTLGLALSSGIDIMITCSLFILLSTSRTDASSYNLNLVIDSLIRYAFETGSLTCAGTVVAMICYLTMSKNLIFMGLHFVISKLYANSLLVTLNTRQNIRRARSKPSLDRDFPSLRLDTRRKRSSPMSSQLEINVERSVEYKSDSVIRFPPEL
ncbi:hypothetical protein DXG01_015605 [Tephrocybe rancida]|nr:hypothetical protein DXG01_015605 [Tephrocybe rancida]